MKSKGSDLIACNRAGDILKITIFLNRNNLQLKIKSSLSNENIELFQALISGKNEAFLVPNIGNV